MLAVHIYRAASWFANEECGIHEVDNSSGTAGIRPSSWNLVKPSCSSNFTCYRNPASSVAMDNLIITSAAGNHRPTGWSDYERHVPGTPQSIL